MQEVLYGRSPGARHNGGREGVSLRRIFVVRVTLVTAAALVSLAAVAAAQSTGQIEGVVLDRSKAALPGVTVEASSPALQGTQVAVTDESGDFRLPLLRPGSYTVRFSLSGFTTVEHGGVVVPLGRTVTLQVQMQPAFREDVTVVSETPAIDVRSAEVGANVTREFFLALPLDRDFVSVVQAAPGTTTDGSGTVVYGSTGLENTYTIDGVNTTNTVNSTSGRVLNFEFIDEVQVRTGGYAAEYGRATGGVVNVITRSGGNDFHGDVFGYYFSDSLQSQPTEEVGAYGREFAGTYTVDAFRKADLGFGLGGYMLKDRLWFFVAYDRIANEEDRRVAKDFSASGGPPEGKIYVAAEERDLWSGKLTWRLAANHSLIASLFGDPSRSDGPVKDLNGEESTFLGTADGGGGTAMLRWEGVLGTSVVVDAQVSRYALNNVIDGPGAGVPLNVDRTTPLYATTGVGFRSGGFGYYWDEQDVRESGRVNAALFLADFGGDHELKAGAEFERVSLDYRGLASGGQVVFALCARGQMTPGGCPAEWAYYAHELYLTGLPPGGAADPELSGYVTDTSGITPRSANPAAYLQDTWRVLPSLTLNLGVRWERQQYYDSHGTLKLDLADEWAPRAGLVWDVGNKGATKVFASWGRFYETAPLMLTFTFNDNVSAETSNRGPLAVECDPALAADPAYWGCTLYSAAATPVDPAGVKGGHLDEALLGLEIAATPSLVLGAKLVYRTLDRIVEDSATADGYYMGNPGYGLLKTALDLQTESLMLPLPPPRRTFTGVELTAVKRLTGNWRMIASYLWSKLEGNYDGSYYPDYDQQMPNLSAAYDYGELAVHNNGYLSNDRRHQAKLSASYRFPFGLGTGVSAYYRSGTPVSALGWSYYGPILYLSQRGAWGRTDDQYEMDLHLGYPVKVGGAQVTFLLDVFNLLDRQSETGRDQRYNLDWTVDVIDYSTGAELPAIAPGTPCASVVPAEWAYSCNGGFNTTNAWQDPRSIRLGVRVTF